MPTGPMRVEYRTISDRCLRCGERPSVVRITQAPSGELYVGSLCEKCATREKAYALEQGMDELPGGTLVADDVSWDLAEHILRSHN